MGYLLCQVAARADREGIRKRGFSPFIAGSVEVCREGREVQAYLTSLGLWDASAITQPETALASAPANLAYPLNLGLAQLAKPGVPVLHRSSCH